MSRSSPRSLALLDRHERIAAAAYTLVASGFAQAMSVGLLRSQGGASAHGSFCEPRSPGGYLVMCLSVGLGLLISNLTGKSRAAGSSSSATSIAWILSPRMLLRLALVVMVIALVLTHSRMGNTRFS